MNENQKSPEKHPIVIVDDHVLFRDGLATILGAEADIEVVGQGGSAEDAIRLARDLLPEIILLDLDMPGGGLAAARTIATATRSPQIRFAAAPARATSCVTALRPSNRDSFPVDR